MKSMKQKLRDKEEEFRDSKVHEGGLPEELIPGKDKEAVAREQSSAIPRLKMFTYSLEGKHCKPGQTVVKVKTIRDQEKFIL